MARVFVFNAVVSEMGHHENDFFLLFIYGFSGEIKYIFFSFIWQQTRPLMLHSGKKWDRAF